MFNPNFYNILTHKISVCIAQISQNVQFKTTTDFLQENALIPILDTGIN